MREVHTYVVLVRVRRLAESECVDVEEMIQSDFIYLKAVVAGSELRTGWKAVTKLVKAKTAPKRTPN